MAFPVRVSTPQPGLDERTLGQEGCQGQLVPRWSDIGTTAQICAFLGIWSYSEGGPNKDSSPHGSGPLLWQKNLHICFFVFAASSVPLGRVSGKPERADADRATFRLMQCNNGPLHALSRQIASSQEN
jgi:hypothetical protein